MNRFVLVVLLSSFTFIKVFGVPVTIPVVTRILHSPADSFAYSRYMLNGPGRSFYVSGYVEGTASSFVARLDSDGSIRWKKVLRTMNWADVENTIPIALTPDSGLIFNYSDGVFSCVDSNGIEKWTSHSTLKAFSDMVEARGGGWFVSVGNSVARLSSGGELLWKQSFANPLYYTSVKIYGIDACSDGGVFATGELKPSQGWGYLWFGKITADGTVEWQKNLLEDTTNHYDSYNGQARGLAIHELPDRTVFIYGTKRSNYASWLLKSDLNGDTLWTRSEWQKGVHLARMQEISLNRILVSSGTGNSVFCIDTGGKKIWEKITHFGSTPYVTGAVESGNSIVVYGADRIPTSSYDTIALRVIEYLPAPHMTRFVFSETKNSVTDTLRNYKCEIGFDHCDVFKKLNLNPDLDIADLNLSSRIYLDKLMNWLSNDFNIVITWNSDTSGLIIELDSTNMKTIRNANPQKAIYNPGGWGYSDTVAIEWVASSIFSKDCTSKNRALYLTSKGFGYELTSDGPVVLRLVDLQGRIIWHSTRMYQKTGRYTITSELRQIANRSCILEMDAGGYTFRSKIIVIGH